MMTSTGDHQARSSGHFNNRAHSRALCIWVTVPEGPESRCPRHCRTPPPRRSQVCLPCVFVLSASRHHNHRSLPASGDQFSLRTKPTGPYPEVCRNTGEILKRFLFPSKLNESFRARETKTVLVGRISNRQAVREVAPGKLPIS